MSVIPQNCRKRGRPRNAALETYRALFPEWSSRTIATYARAMERLRMMGWDEQQHRQMIQRVTRANGSLNVALLDELTESAAAMWATRFDQ